MAELDKFINQFHMEEISLPEYQALLNTMNGYLFSFRGIYDNSIQYQYGDLCVITTMDKSVFVYLGKENGWKRIPSVLELD